MARVETLTDVPDDLVDERVAGFEAEGATVKKTKQANGLWTIEATFP